jgi:uncharacterized cupin superfamily protein
MSMDRALWVMGHKIRPLDTDESYGMVEITSPPHVPGPPPHYHKNEREFFFLVRGTLDVMSDGVWRTFTAGSFVDLPPNTTHTFINNAEEDAVWLTGWRPKGFQKFFEDFGVPAHEANARERSTADDLIRRAVESIERYGMYIPEKS